MSSGRNITASTKPWPEPKPVDSLVPFEFVHINKCGGTSIAIALGLQKSHDTAAQRRWMLGEDAWNAAFTFATVRNPFDRVASIYYHRVRSDQHGLANRHLSFNGWVREAFGEHNPRYWDGNRFVRPAIEWVRADGAEIVDRVVRLEDIAIEWPKICDVLGVRRDLQVMNDNSRPPYGAVFDPTSRSIVEEQFGADIERFGYTYESD